MAGSRRYRTFGRVRDSVPIGVGLSYRRGVVDTGDTLAQPRRAPPGLQLLIMEPGGSHRVDLPGAGLVEVGRGDGVDIRIDDPSISREHAALHIGKTLQIEDLDSVNGTFLHGERLVPRRPVDVLPGEFFEVGVVVCVVRGRATHERLRQLRSHDYFEARLQDEVARARHRDGHPAVVRLRLDQDDDDTIAELLASVRPGDVVARYAPCEYELLVAGDDLDAGSEVAAEVAARLARVRRPATLGLAVFPVDGGSAEELFDAACQAAAPHSEAQPEPALVVEAPAMRRLHDLVSRVARAGVNVLLLGETGVGKEVFAGRIHAESPRASQPLVKLNCAAFPAALLESELFGHEKAAFTGADRRKIGLLEAAHGGMVFLDEIGELEAGAQVKLLRVIEEGRLRRVGGVDEVSVDVVFVSATNRDLEAEVAAGRFRADLYYRLNGFSLTIPPLRERTEEIAALARRFAAAAAHRTGGPAPKITDEALGLLGGYSWPGNIRELRNMMERGVLLSSAGVIGVEQLPVGNLRVATSGGIERALARAAEAGGMPSDLTDDERADRRAIVEALATTAGNQTRAAELLGISRRWLSTKMARYKIPRPRKR